MAENTEVLGCRSDALEEALDGDGETAVLVVVVAELDQQRNGGVGDSSVDIESERLAACWMDGRTVEECHRLKRHFLGRTVEALAV